VSNSPNWLTGINALPMYLGLDLRGGVHFLLQVDMKGALTKRLDSVAADLRTLLREKNLRHAGIARSGQAVQVQFRDAEMRDKAKQAIASSQPELQLAETLTGADFTLVATLRPEAIKTFQDDALKQNIATLNKRINELAVAEPVIQQQGADRIVVQLPGVQDVARAKDLIGRTATLEVRLVEQASVAGSDAPVGTDLIPERRRDGSINMVAVRKLVVLTGDRFNGAQATFDENQRPAVAVQLDAAGGRIMRDVTRENLKKMMAIILIEKGRPEAISVATIQGEFGNRFQITGMFSRKKPTPWRS
jgi:preprotein translocase subunit SecD